MKEPTLYDYNDVFNILSKYKERKISYFPIYREIAGSLSSAIVLSQLMFWFSKQDVVYKTNKDFQDELNLTDKELKNAKTYIKKLSFIKITLEGVPAKTFYRIDREEFVSCLMKTIRNRRSQLDSPKGPNKMIPKVPPNTYKKTNKEYNLVNPSFQEGERDFSNPENKPSKLYNRTREQINKLRNNNSQQDVLVPKEIILNSKERRYIREWNKYCKLDNSRFKELKEETSKGRKIKNYITGIKNLRLFINKTLYKKGNVSFPYNKTEKDYLEFNYSLEAWEQYLARINHILSDPSLKQPYIKPTKTTKGKLDFNKFIQGDNRNSIPPLLLSFCLDEPKALKKTNNTEMDLNWIKTLYKKIINPDYKFTGKDNSYLDIFLSKVIPEFSVYDKNPFLNKNRKKRLPSDPPEVPEIIDYHRYISWCFDLIEKNWISKGKPVTPSILAQDFVFTMTHEFIKKLGY